MEHFDHLMDMYEEALEELMGAQKYAKRAAASADADEKSMFRTMAKQELEHETMLLRDGDRISKGGSHADVMQIVWARLKKHLNDWRMDIERHLNEL